MEVSLVTGGNSGIGFEVVRQLAKEGMIVYLGSRDPAKGIAAAAERGRCSTHTSRFDR